MNEATKAARDALSDILRFAPTQAALDEAIEAFEAALEAEHTPEPTERLHAFRAVDQCIHCGAPYADGHVQDNTEPAPTEVLCQLDGMTSSGVDYGKCLLPEPAHDGECPDCHGTTEIWRGDEPMRGCMPCLTGLGPHGHKFQPPVREPAPENEEALTDVTDAVERVAALETAARQAFVEGANWQRNRERARSTSDDRLRAVVEALKEIDAVWHNPNATPTQVATASHSIAERALAALRSPERGGE